MPRSIQLNRQMRRYRRPAAALVALLAVVGVLAGAHSWGMGAHHHMGGHAKGTVLACVTFGGCALVVATAAVAVRPLAQRGRWSVLAPPAPAVADVPEAARFLARAGPPPVLQVFRL